MTANSVEQVISSMLAVVFAGWVTVVVAQVLWHTRKGRKR